MWSDALLWTLIWDVQDPSSEARLVLDWANALILGNLAQIWRLPWRSCHDSQYGTRELCPVAGTYQYLQACMMTALRHKLGL